MSQREIEQAVRSLLEDVHQADVLRMNSKELGLLSWDLDQLSVKHEVNPNFVRVWLPEAPLEKRHEVLTLFRNYRLNLMPTESIQEQEELPDPSQMDLGNAPEELPDMCLAYIPEQEAGGGLVLIKKGEQGYFTIDQKGLQHLTDRYGPPSEEVAIIANHALRYATEAQMRAMIAGSMFGWDTTAADPSRYERVQAQAL